MELVIYSIILLIALIINSLKPLLGPLAHKIPFALYATFIAVTIWKNIGVKPKYKTVFKRISVALIVSALSHVMGIISPGYLASYHNFQTIMIPRSVISIFFLLAFFTYYRQLKDNMDIRRIRGNILFAEVITLLSFFQVFLNWYDVVEWTKLDIISIIILSISATLITTGAFSIFISNKFSKMCRSDIFLLFAFFALSFIDLIMIFNFKYLFIHKVPFYYSNVKFIGIGFFGYAILYLKNKKVSSDEKVKNEDINNAFNPVLSIMVLPIVLLMSGLISTMNFIIQLILVVGYQFSSYYYDKSGDIYDLQKREYKNMQKLKSQLRERIDELTELNNELDVSVNTDALTGLKNRYFLNNKMRKLFKNPPEAFTLMYLDLDKFKVINDVHGHNIGDIVIVEVANRLTEISQERADVCRIGGDEFILITPESDRDMIEHCAQDIMRAITQPIYINNIEFNVGLSIGIATMPRTVERLEDLLRSAEIAMYCAKRSEESNCIMFYQPSQMERIKRDNILSLSLSSDSVFDGLKITYMPIIELKSQKVLAAEARILWCHSELGIIENYELLRIIDQSDRSEKFISWFINQSTKELATWKDKYDYNMKLHLKISVQMLNINRLSNIIEEAIRKHKLSMEDLCIDIKEEELMRSYELVKDTLVHLKSMGLNIAISEFGDGKTAFHILRKIDFDYIKFAEIFVSNIEDGDRDEEILKAMVNLSQKLGHMAIVPYVKNKKQMLVIKDLDVEFASGEYFEGKM